MRKTESSSTEAITDSWSHLVDLAQAEISRAIIELLRKEPFFGHLLASTPRHFTTRIETLAVVLRGSGIQLVTNPRFFLKTLRSAEERTAVLKHEVLHIVFKHIFRAKLAGSDKLLWNIAADLVVNQYVSPFRLPKGAIILSTFPDLALRPHDTMENYFRELKRLDSISRGRTGASSAPFSSDALSRLKSGSVSFPSDHNGWGDGKLGELDDEPTGSDIPGMIRDAIARSVENQILAAHYRGAVSRSASPAWLERLIADISDSRKPKVDWRKVVRVFAASGKRTRLRLTMMKESRRFESLVGMRRPAGVAIRSHQRFAVIIDTSGSIDDSQLKSFFDEVNGIYRQGAEIVIAECDDAVRHIYQYTGVAPSKVAGGGGTSFEPAMQWLNARENGRFDACIYLTDGAGSLPETRPPCPVLWVLNNACENTKLPYGRQVVMSD